MLTAWALLRLHDRATFGNALVVGFTAGFACLTRITALSFILPALVWIAMTRGGEERRGRLTYTATAFLVMAALVAPFLISCAIATGDPFFAINYHTGYYRFGENLPIDRPMTAAEYIRRKFAGHPLGTLDVAINGLFVRPFATSWQPFGIWLAGLPMLLPAAALAGLAMWPFSARGRLMLVLLVTSLVPYAFTWNISGGGEWRFTMHALPIFLIAAVYAIAVLIRAVRTRPSLRPFALPAAAVIAAAIAATALYMALPWFTVREAIANGEAANIMADRRGWVFYREDWSETHAEGLARVRVSRGARTTLHFPLPKKREYQVVIRVDPVAPERQNRLDVLFNSQLVRKIDLLWDPQRFGSYRLTLPADWVVVGENKLTLIPGTTVTAGSAGSRFTWLDPADVVGVRMWYLRVLD